MERGDGRAVGAVEQAQPPGVTPADVPTTEPAASSAGARPCEMMLSAPDEKPRACGTTPTVGGNKLYRYCKAHLEMVERGGGVVYRDGWA